MSCRYECACCLAVFMFVWVERIVISSAYVISFILLFGGVRISDVNILNSVGESTPPCGTLVFIVACFDFVLLYIVNCFRPRMQFDRSFITILFKQQTALYYLNNESPETWLHHVGRVIVVGRSYSLKALLCHLPAFFIIESLQFSDSNCVALPTLRLCILYFHGSPPENDMHCLCNEENLLRLIASPSSFMNCGLSVKPLSKSVAQPREGHRGHVPLPQQ